MPHTRSRMGRCWLGLIGPANVEINHWPRYTLLKWSYRDIKFVPDNPIIRIIPCFTMFSDSISKVLFSLLTWKSRLSTSKHESTQMSANLAVILVPHNQRCHVGHWSLSWFVPVLVVRVKAHLTLDISGRVHEVVQCIIPDQSRLHRTTFGAETETFVGFMEIPLVISQHAWARSEQNGLLYSWFIISIFLIQHISKSTTKKTQLTARQDQSWWLPHYHSYPPQPPDWMCARPDSQSCDPDSDQPAAHQFSAAQPDQPDLLKNAEIRSER